MDGESSVSEGEKKAAIFDANKFGYNGKPDGLFNNEMDFGSLDDEFNNDGFDAKLDGKFKGGEGGYDFNQAFNVQGMGFFETGKDSYDEKADNDDDGNNDIGGQKFVGFGFGDSW